MRPSVLHSSTQPVHLYPRLRTLSRLGSFQHRPGPIRAAYSSSKPIVKWAFRLNNHLAVSPTLHHANYSISAPSRNTASPEISRHSQTTRTMKDPIQNRPASPYANPSVQGPKHQILSSGTQHDLRKTAMLSHTVNRTGLHPGGVAYVTSIFTPSSFVPSCIGTLPLSIELDS